MRKIPIAIIVFVTTCCLASGCHKKPQMNIAESPQSMSPLQTDTNQNETDNIIKYCESGNCPCGDGFCSKGGYCIQDKCFCGANPDKGTFDIQVVASNNYGEFECTA